MNDEQLSRDLEEALSIEPSPQFLARVRRQIVSESTRPAIHWKWAATTAGIAAAVLMGIAVSQPKPEALLPAAIATMERALPLSDIPAADIPAAPAPSAVASAKGRSTSPSVRSPEPEILIDPRETAALQGFLQDVLERKIDNARLEELFESAEKVRTITIEPMPIAAIDPIVILPLGSATPETGEDL